MVLSKLIVNMKGAIENIAYKSKVMTRNVSVTPQINFKIHSANPGTLHFGKETLLRALLQNLKQGEVTYDIGANIGLYTLALSIHQPTNQVYAFEPSPDTFAKLTANLLLNKTSSNVKPLQVAIGNTNGEVNFMISSEQERSSLFTSEASFGVAEVKKTIKVTVRTLDSFIGQLPPPRHIKIDAEGSEAIILEGAAETIRKYKPLLYIEPHSFALENKISMILQLLDYEFENYRGHYICNAIGSPRPEVTPDMLSNENFAGSAVE